MKEYLKKNKDLIETPSYYFDIDEFRKRAYMIKKEIGDIPLTYSIKANPFLLLCIPDSIDKVEVCSPGELRICIELHINPEKIIYSGVNKGEKDLLEALDYHVDIVTAESVNQIALEQNIANEKGVKQKVILRVTSGNQFGMSPDNIMDILKSSSEYPNLIFYGIHYYSGTQKKLKQVENDLKVLSDFLGVLHQEVDFLPKLVEIGPGLATEYFNDDCDEKDYKLLKEVAPLIRKFSQKYKTGVEMGRFLAASCGTYATKVKDIKFNDETNYVICDGGIHHLRYYGQNMAMQIPRMEVLNTEKQKDYYCICGSLCTTADVLVREVELGLLKVDDIILFHRCGAYSITEGTALFLSRELPSVYLFSKEYGLKKLRSMTSVHHINMFSKNIQLAEVCDEDKN